jgi:hypothetical protein
MRRLRKRRTERKEMGRMNGVVLRSEDVKGKKKGWGFCFWGTSLQQGVPESINAKRCAILMQPYTKTLFISSKPQPPLGIS